MKIFILTMDDPVQINDFIKNIIDKRKSDIVGLAVCEGDRLTINGNKSKLEYLLSLFLIMGLRHFVLNSIQVVIFKLRKRLSGSFSIVDNPSIGSYAKQNDIQVWNIKSPNNSQFLLQLKKLSPDIIINQSQSILKQEILSIPKIGIINRHNSLLPQNRGRLSPFWVLYKGEKTTGVSIHFVDKEIDTGDIIIQEKFPVEEEDNFNTLVKKSYEVAQKAILKALTKLEQEENSFIKNTPDSSKYNSIPTFREALSYRLKKFRKFPSSHA